MRKSTVAIVVIWVGILGEALWQGISLPGSRIAEISSAQKIPPAIFVLSFVIVLLGAFSQRHKGFDARFLSSFFDSRYGQRTTGMFLRRLRPVILVMVAMLIFGGSGLIASHLGTKASAAYVLSGFSISMGLGLLAACLLSTRFPPRLY